MSFQFTQRSGIEKQVRSIARGQITRALEACYEPRGNLDDLVHQLRRRCKKLRGLVRLIEPKFKNAKRENRAFRDAAAGLAGRRDAAVMVETFSQILELDHNRKGRPQISATQAKDLLNSLQQAVGGPPDAVEATLLLRSFIEIFETAKSRAGKWELSGKGFDQIGDGLEATYRRMQTGLAVVERGASAEAIHAWRKDTKYHWHHVSLFVAAAPDTLTARRDNLDRLGEWLGDHHNLAVLDATLADFPDIEAVRRVIAERQAALAADAIGLGRQLLAEKPNMLRERFERYWTLLPKKD